MTARWSRLGLAASGAATLLLGLLVPLGASHTLDVWVNENIQQPLGHWEGPAPAPDDTARSVRGAWVSDVPGVGVLGSLGSPEATFAATAALGLVLALCGRWRSAWAAVAASAAGALLTIGLQALFDPLTAHLRAGPTQPVPFLFPSGHTTGAVFVWGLALLVPLRALAGPAPPRGARRLAAGAWLAIGIGAGLDRILAGQHVAGDVAAGWALGTFLLCAALALEERFGSQAGQPDEPAP